MWESLGYKIIAIFCEASHTKIIHLTMAYQCAVLTTGPKIKRFGRQVLFVTWVSIKKIFCEASYTKIIHLTMTYQCAVLTTCPKIVRFGGQVLFVTGVSIKKIFWRIYKIKMVLKIKSTLISLTRKWCLSITRFLF